MKEAARLTVQTPSTPPAAPPPTVEPVEPKAAPQRVVMTPAAPKPVKVEVEVENRRPALPAILPVLKRPKIADVKEWRTPLLPVMQLGFGQPWAPAMEALSLRASGPFAGFTPRIYHAQYLSSASIWEY